jgi:hypothetical protein
MRYSLWYQHKKKQISHSVYTRQSCSFLTSVVITGVQMREMSKLGWLIRWSSRDMWVDSLYFLYVVFGSICKTFASFQDILWPFLYACWADFDFSSKPHVRLYLCSLMHTFIEVCLFRQCNIHKHMGCCTHTASSAGHLWPVQFSAMSHGVYV